MHKLRLRIEELRVDSFDVEPGSRGARGTVRGAEFPQINPEQPDIPPSNFGEDCLRTDTGGAGPTGDIYCISNTECVAATVCGPGTCFGENTCDASCWGTCDYTCAPTCALPGSVCA